MDSESERKERIDSQVTFKNDSETVDDMDYFQRAGKRWIMRNGS